MQNCNEDKDIIISYIRDAKETFCVDFKRVFYESLASSDFPKDVSAFANAIGDEDKYIIFGVDDDSREITGIDPQSFPNQDTLDNFIAQKIEPFIKVECGIVQIDELYVGYIKVLSTNCNPPYVIKVDCGKKSTLRSGDVFIRKGTCNLKANRADIDAMYLNNGTISIALRDTIIPIEPICCKGEIVENPTYGHMDAELFNETTRPSLIDFGLVIITAGERVLERRIRSILPSQNLSEKPFLLTAGERGVHTILFDFFSQDCVDLDFNPDGFMEDSVKIQVLLSDTDKKEYCSDVIEADLLAKGDILHKVQLIERKEQKSDSFLNKLLKR